MPGTKQRARSQILKQHLLGSAWGNLMFLISRNWSSPTVLRDWNSSPPLPKSLTFSRIKRKTGKPGKTRSLSSVLGLPNRKAAKCFSSHLDVLKFRRSWMNLAATWSTNQRTWSVQESKALVHCTLYMTSSGSWGTKMPDHSWHTTWSKRTGRRSSVTSPIGHFGSPCHSDWMGAASRTSP